MRFDNIIALLLTVICANNINVYAFCAFSLMPRCSSSARSQFSSILQLSEPNNSEVHTKQRLTSAEILARSREAIGKEEPVSDEEKKFDDDILEDFRAVLQFLENRAKRGPGSFSMQEMTDFEKSSSRLLQDMKEKYGNNQDDSLQAENPQMSASVVAMAPPPPPPPMPSMLAAAKQEIQNHSHKKDDKDVDISNDEGPAYDGKGGMGLASGTTNTYIIPGMDEMTGEEYRKALQASVSARQEQRRTQNRGLVGNRAAHSYLEQLGYGGASQNLSGSNLAEQDTN